MRFSKVEVQFLLLLLGNRVIPSPQIPDGEIHMTAMITKVVSVRVKRPDGTNFDPIRVTDKEVTCFDQDYGPHRKERQQAERTERVKNWQKLLPHEQLASLDLRLGVDVGAAKQRAKIASRIERAEEAKKQAENKARRDRERDEQIRKQRAEKNQRREQQNRKK
jgi:hypothetical protein